MEEMETENENEMETEMEMERKKYSKADVYPQKLTVTECYNWNYEDKTLKDDGAREPINHAFSFFIFFSCFVLFLFQEDQTKAKCVSRRSRRRSREKENNNNNGILRAKMLYFYF